MHALTILTVAVAAVSAAPLGRRWASIMNDLTTINDDTNNLKAKVQGYDGGSLFSALPIKKASKKLNQHIKDATSNIGYAGELSAADSQEVIDYINQTLEPSVVQAMAALQDKEGKIAESHLRPKVSHQIGVSKNRVDALGAGVVGKVPTDKKGAVQAALAKVDADFAATAQRFS